MQRRVLRLWNRNRSPIQRQWSWPSVAVWERWETLRWTEETWERKVKKIIIKDRKGCKRDERVDRKQWNHLDTRLLPGNCPTSPSFSHTESRHHSYCNCQAVSDSVKTNVYMQEQYFPSLWQYIFKLNVVFSCRPNTCGESSSISTATTVILTNNDLWYLFLFNHYAVLPIYSTSKKQKKQKLGVSKFLKCYFFFKLHLFQTKI